MAGQWRPSIEGQIRTLWTIGTVGEADDSALLSRFARRQDEPDDAFRILVERHGPMVVRVCRQVLGDNHDAEDAAQAVFLVLARKAHVIRVKGSIAPWLHGVARWVAAKARGRSAARRQAESRTARISVSLRDVDSKRATEASDWEAVHEEVERLPEKYRTPVVLCYLEGETYEATAQRIGCPVGTVRVRLARARVRLRDRLSRRGFGPERISLLGLVSKDLDARISLIMRPTTDHLLLRGGGSMRLSRRHRHSV